MSPSAVYSKSGKGVQESGGKTTLLGRAERAVLAAIDGRATLGQVAQKVGKAFDSEFRQLVRQLDSDGFIREVSDRAKPGKAAGKADEASDLDFTASMPAQKRSAPLPPPQAAPAKPAPAPRPTTAVPPPPPPPSADEKAKAERIAREQQSEFARAREEAERKQAEERERQKAEAEARLRAETEARIRIEAEQKARAHSETEQQRVRALEEEKARAETQAKVAAAAREAAVREAARLAAEAKAKAEAESEQLRRRLEEERKAREVAERKAREDAERARQEAEERVRREAEQMRRQLEEERRRMQEEHKRLEEEQLTRRLENEQRERALLEARRRAEQDEQEAENIRQTLQARQGKRAAPPPATTGDAFADSLMQDLEASAQRDEEEERRRQADHAALAAMQAMQRQEAELKAREEAERSTREGTERERREADKSRRKDEKESRKREEEAAARAEREAEDRIAREEERRKEEAAARQRKDKEEEKLAARASASASGYSAADEAKRRRALAQSAAQARERRRSHPGRAIAVTLLAVLVLGLAAAHFVPLPKADYEMSASETLGRAVKVRAAHLWLVPAPHLRLEGVTVGDRATIAVVRAFPDLEKLLGGSIAFRRLELEGATLRQDGLAEALFAKAKPAGMTVTRVQARDLKLPGPMPLAPLDVEAVVGADGGLRSATLRGPDGLAARLVARSAAIEFDLSAARFTLPFAPDLTLSAFAMKGTATPHVMNVSAWDGTLYNGTLSGTASLRWGGTWNIEGAIKARGINAGLFAPALLSDGRAEANGRFSLSGSDPAKLGRTGRVEGSFTVNKGVISGFDLSRAIQTEGRQVTGRTPFSEMNGHAVYDRGSVALRNVTIGAGALNAGASADITQNGALSGRVVADVRSASRTLRATLLLGGTVKEPQVQN